MWGDSKLMTMREKHFVKLLDRAFTLVVSLPFRSHWVSMSILPAARVKLKWGQRTALYLDDILSASFPSSWSGSPAVPPRTLERQGVWGSGLFPPRPFWRDSVPPHKKLRGGSGFLCLQGVSNQPWSHTRQHVPLLTEPLRSPCLTKGRKEETRQALGAFSFLFKEAFENIRSHNSVTMWTISVGLKPRLACAPESPAKGLSCKN